MNCALNHVGFRAAIHPAWCMADCGIFFIIRLLNHYVLGETILITQLKGCGYGQSAINSFVLPQTSILKPLTFFKVGLLPRPAGCVFPNISKDEPVGHPLEWIRIEESPQEDSRLGVILFQIGLLKAARLFSR